MCVGFVFMAVIRRRRSGFLSIVHSFSRMGVVLLSPYSGQCMRKCSRSSLTLIGSRCCGWLESDGIAVVLFGIILPPPLVGV